MESQKSKNNQCTKSNQQIELISDQFAFQHPLAEWLYLSLSVCLVIVTSSPSSSSPSSPCFDNPVSPVTPSPWSHQSTSKALSVFLSAQKKRSTKKTLKAVSLFKAIIVSDTSLTDAHCSMAMSMSLFKAII